jgi:hypothetical protein
VAGDAVGPEPAEHMGCGKGGEVAEGADPQPGQQLGQPGVPEDAHRKRGQEVGGPSWWDDQATPGGKDGGEQPVGHADLDRGDVGGRTDDRSDQRVLTAEVASRPAGGK